MNKLKVILLVAVVLLAMTFTFGSDKAEYGGRRGIPAEGKGGDVLGGLLGENSKDYKPLKGTVKTPIQEDINIDGKASRSKEEIAKTVEARMPALRSIYNKHLKEKPNLNGKITLKFTIAPSGEIISINIMSSATGDSEFDEAIKNAVAKWKWKSIEGGNTTVIIPFNFE